MGGSFERHASGETDQPMFRRAIGRIILPANRCSGRADIDDPTPGARHHSRKHGAYHPECAVEVGVDDLGPEIVGMAADRVLGGRAGGIHEDIGGAAGGLGLGSECGDRVIVAHIEMGRMNLDAMRRKLSDDGLENSGLRVGCSILGATALLAEE
jgi:hypothetical protein